MNVMVSSTCFETVKIMKRLRSMKKCVLYFVSSYVLSFIFSYKFISINLMNNGLNHPVGTKNGEFEVSDKLLNSPWQNPVMQSGEFIMYYIQYTVVTIH